MTARPRVSVLDPGRGVDRELDRRGFFGAFVAAVLASGAARSRCSPGTVADLAPPGSAQKASAAARRGRRRLPVRWTDAEGRQSRVAGSPKPCRSKPHRVFVKPHGRALSRCDRTQCAWTRSPALVPSAGWRRRRAAPASSRRRYSGASPAKARLDRALSAQDHDQLDAAAAGRRDGAAKRVVNRVRRRAAGRHDQSPPGQAARGRQAVSVNSRDPQPVPVGRPPAAASPGPRCPGRSRCPPS